ncbi:hypothetical protein LTR29_011031 [Friedmanniomyces endolithicus]|nr:hypothetical protein LTR29_011031 [Friedmanniomyces endolithicus]
MRDEQNCDSKVDLHLPSPSAYKDSRPETPVSSNEGINRPPKQKDSQRTKGTMENIRSSERSSIKQQLNKFLESAERQMVAAEDLEAKLVQVFLQKLEEREDKGKPTVRKNFPEQYNAEGDKSWLRKVFRAVLPIDPMSAAGRRTNEDMDDEEPTPPNMTKTDQLQPDAAQPIERRQPKTGKKPTSEIMKYLNETAPIGDTIAVQQRRANPAKDQEQLRPRARVHHDERANDGEESEDGEAEPSTSAVKRPESFVVCDRSLAIRNGCAEALSSDTKTKDAGEDSEVSGISHSVRGSAPRVVRSWQMVEGKMAVYPPFADAESQSITAESARSESMAGVPKVAVAVRPHVSVTERSWQWIDGKTTVWPSFDGESHGGNLTRGMKRKVAVEEEVACKGKKVGLWRTPSPSLRLLGTQGSDFIIGSKTLQVCV